LAGNGKIIQNKYRPLLVPKKWPAWPGKRGGKRPLSGMVI
jgi:hypothetical protein